MHSGADTQTHACTHTNVQKTKTFSRNQAHAAFDCAPGLEMQAIMEETYRRNDKLASVKI